MEFDNGVQIGEEIFTDMNGNVKSKSNYLRNAKEGESRTYYPNGKLKRLEIYKMGNLQGECKNYNQMGKLISVEEHWNNKLSKYSVL